MPITIETHFDSAVVEANQDVFSRSYIEGTTTIIEFDMRKRDYRKELGTDSAIYWPSKSYEVDAHEFSTFHNPIVYRFILAQGYYFDDEGNRFDFTPKIAEVSTHQHISKSVIRLSCFLSVICGVSLRNIATIFSLLFLIPVTKSTIKRWIDEIGENLPSEEEILKKLADIQQPSQCHIDAYYPLGTNRCVMVIKDEFDRILITHEADSENSEEAKKFLRRIKDSGLKITEAFSDYSKSFTEAIKEVFPAVRFQADHFHTAKNVWKHLKKALLEYRKDLKGSAEKENNQKLIDMASKLWKLRWSLLKKPSNLSRKERKAIEELEESDGFILKFRSILRQVVNIFDHSSTELQAEIKLKKLKSEIDQTKSTHLAKIAKFFDEHWHEAMYYLKKKGLGKYRRSSNSESGMRLLRRLEKNHDGIRSEITRKNYIKIYQMIKYLSSDVTDFLNPQPRQDEA
jgi:hypothetical protein